MTADLRILGNGRVLNHPELVGRSLCYFLTVTFAGRTFRWCFPSARDVWVGELDGDQYHFQGMDYPQMSQSFDFDSDSPVDISVSFEDLTFPGDVNLPELLAQGHRLERCEAELAALPDHPDSLWSERQIVLVGEVREPVYGDPETHANTAGFTVDSPSWEDTSLFPPDDWVVTEEAWPTAHESAIGKVFPFVFGAPGFIANPSGVREATMGSPGLCVAGDRYMFAGHIVTENTYDVSVFTIQTFTNVTANEVYQGTAGNGNVPRLELATSASGFQYTDCNFAGQTNYTQGDEIWIQSWAVGAGLVSGITVAQERTLGGYPNFEWDGPLFTAGDVLYFMLLQSSLKVDRGRTAVAQALLQAYRVSGYIDERVTPYEWITDNLIPILPVAMSQGPKGIYPIVWRYDAGPNDCVGHFREGPRWRRVSSVERDDSNILNKYTLSYGLDGGDFLMKFGVDGAIEEATDTSETGATYVPNLYARRSYLEHGTIAVDESSDIVTTVDTAALVCAWKIRANALAKRTVTYEATAEHAWLEPGDPILVTDPDLYFDQQVCLVRTKTWDVTSVLYELLILSDPARETVPVDAALPVPTAFIEACVAQGTCLGVWLPPEGVTDGADIHDGDIVLADATGTSSETIKAELASDGNWVWDAADTPTADFGVTINTQTNRGQTNYMGLTGAIPAAKTAIFIFRVATAQGANQSTQLGGGTGGVLAPNGQENSWCWWENTNANDYRFPNGAGPTIAHADYTGWVAGGFLADGTRRLDLSKVGDVWQSIGTANNGGGYATWTGFNAFSGNSAGNNEETGSGTVKYAGVAMFSGSLSQADIQNILIAGGLITA